MLWARTRSVTQPTVRIFQRARLGPRLAGLDVQAAQRGRGQPRQRRDGDVQLVLRADQHEVALAETANAGARERASRLSSSTAALAWEAASPTSGS